MIEVLTEGSSDVYAIREVLTRRFGLASQADFRIHPHQGRGELPKSVLAQPSPTNRSLLHQLPAKLRAFGKSLGKKDLVLVLVDADDTPKAQLLTALNAMYTQLPTKPPTVFGVAVEETESWFIADPSAVKAAYPKANVAVLKKIKPDAVCGAWESLARAIGLEPKGLSNPGFHKAQWAERISPHLNLCAAPSPSLRGLIEELHTSLG